MKFYWLLPSFLSIFLLAGAAEAARLESWRFDASQNRLYITTEGGVQPRAQLIFNPTRLVIDLPGTSLGRSSVSQQVSGAIESVRVGQFDTDTTRIVIQLRDGFTIDPQQVKFRGVSPSEWTVDIPQPISAGQNSSSESGRDKLSIEPAAVVPETAEAIVVQGVQVTGEGLAVRTAGGQPQINFQQSRAGDIATLDIEGATLAPGLNGQQPQTNGKHGLDKIEIRQLPTEPPIARVTLRMKNSGTEWQASLGNGNQILLAPAGARQPALSRRSPASIPERQAQRTLARVQSIVLNSNGSQLVVRTDRQVSYTSGWDRESRAYWIRLGSSSLAGSIPQLDENSPVSFTATQEDAETVVIWVQPRSGTEVGRITRPSPQLLSLQLRSASSSQPSLSRNSNLQPLPRRTTDSGDLPQVSNGRRVVIVDPGHGGRDPGAIGIGGIQEKDIVLDISFQVARILEQQGVQVVMTRTDDSEIDLQPRVSLAERVNATIFVSIHANAINMSRPDVSGIETYYFDNGEALARTIHNSILEGTGATDRRVRQARFYVLRKTSMPSVLLETGFVTGAEDAARLADPAYRSVMAASIARGILLYLQQR